MPSFEFNDSSSHPDAGLGGFTGDVYVPLSGTGLGSGAINFTETSDDGSAQAVNFTWSFVASDNDALISYVDNSDGYLGAFAQGGLGATEVFTLGLTGGNQFVGAVSLRFGFAFSGWQIKFDGANTINLGTSVFGSTFTSAVGTYSTITFIPSVGGSSLNLNELTVAAIAAPSASPTLNANTGSTVLEGGTDIVTVTELDYNDSDTADASLTYTVTGNSVANGTLYIDNDGSNTFNGGDTTLGLGSTFTQQTIVNNDLQYEHNGSETTSDSFGFQISDGPNTITGQTFNFSVTPVNDLPVIGNVDSNVVNYFEGFTTTNIDVSADATVSDADNANFAGGSLTVSFSAGGQTEDDITIANTGFGAGVTGLLGNQVFSDGVNIGTFSGGTGGTALVVSLSALATPANTAILIRNLLYQNQGGDNPNTTGRTVDVVLNDGTDNSATSQVTINIIAQNDTPDAIDDAIAVFDDLNPTTAINLFAANPTTADSDPDSGFTITSVQGGMSPAATDGGGIVTVTDNANGIVTYDPNGAFEYLPAGVTANDTFTYTISDPEPLSDSATVTITITGVDNNDVFDGATQTGAMDGGVNGVDTITYAAAASGVTFDFETPANNLGDAAGDAPSDIERVVGSADNDNLFGDGNTNILVGGGGNDTIDGGAGSDTLTGGLGNDLLYVDNAGDVIQEATGEGSADRVATNVSYVITAGAEIELFTTKSVAGTTALELTGNAFAQTIVGNAGDNIIADGGGAGADFLRGLGGNDTYIVRNSGTTIEEKSSAGANDRVAAGVDYTLADGVFVELLTTTSTGATTGIDLTGNTGAQTIVGNAANNTISDGGGAAANGDILKGLAGSDFYIVRNEGTLVQELVGQGAFDRVAVSKSYALAAGAEVESLRTTSMHGTNAIDLTGNEFGQQIIGNAGANTLTGNGGNDTFFFGSALGGSNIDNVTDFTVTDDTFALVQTIFNGIAATGALDADAFVANTTGNAEDASDRIIYNSNTGGVFYDPDGIGGTAATQFATVTAGLGITAAEFTVV